jgi:hypothetical protein
MTTTVTKPSAKPSTSYSLDYRTWLGAGVCCERCRLELKAKDVVIDDDGSVRLTYSGCGSDILIIERI